MGVFFWRVRTGRLPDILKQGLLVHNHDAPFGGNSRQGRRIFLWGQVGELAILLGWSDLGHPRRGDAINLKICHRLRFRRLPWGERYP